MSLAVIFQTLLEAGGDQGSGQWVWGDSHCPVILLHILSTIFWIAIILRIFDCHDIACDLKLGQGHSDLYFMLQ